MAQGSVLDLSTLTPTVIFSILNKQLPKASSGHILSSVISHSQASAVHGSPGTCVQGMTLRLPQALLYSRMVLGTYEAVLGVDTG